MNRKGILFVSLSILVLCFYAPLYASVIDFSTAYGGNSNNYAYNNHDPVPTGFGSTADLTVSYATLSQTDLSVLISYIDLWHTGYANMTAAGFPNTNGNVLAITLTASPGKLVTLNSFDIGGYGSYSRTASIFEIVDSTNFSNILWNNNGYTIPLVTAATLSPNVSANSITLLLGYDWNNGVNNINFSAMRIKE